MQTGFHHAYHAAHTGKLKKYAKTMDHYAFLMGFVAVAVNVPQLVDVYTRKDVSGVSVVSWAGFLLGAVFWLFYGLLHRARTLVVINAMLIVVQSLIVFRLLLG